MIIRSACPVHGADCDPVLTGCDRTKVPLRFPPTNLRGIRGHAVTLRIFVPIDQCSTGNPTVTADELIEALMNSGYGHTFTDIEDAEIITT